MKKYVFVLFSFCIVLFAETEFATPKPSITSPRHIVFSISKGDDYAFDHILSIANNVLKFYGPENVEMKIVAYSQGIKLLLKKNKKTATRIDALMQYDVEFIACGNSMRTLHIKKEDLVDDAEIVTAGIVEIIESIKKGWVYIKP